MNSGRLLSRCCRRATQAEGRMACGALPSCPERHPLRAALWHPLGDAAAGDGLVKRIRFTRRHLLAAAARLAGGWCVGPAAPGAAAPLAPGGPDRLDPCLHGQRVHRSQKGGGAGTGPNPTDRGKAGTKRHLLTDRRGIPLAYLLSGANTHDSRPFEDLLDAVPPIPGKPGRPRRRPDKLHADKAYDHGRCRRACLRRGIKSSQRALAS